MASGSQTAARFEHPRAGSIVGPGLYLCGTLWSTGAAEVGRGCDHRAPRQLGAGASLCGDDADGVVDLDLEWLVLRSEREV
jgi:hypothetical protein